jgi:predicted NUDIX family phosphoesterase
MSENVLVFNASILPELETINGCINDAATAAVYGNKIFLDSPEKPFFKDRESAESDESVKQIIPYIIVRLNTDEQGEDKFLVYQRTKQSGESRLMGKHSIGVGGHINEDDKSPKVYARHESQVALEAFFACIRREISEELEIDLYPGFHIRGVIYDPSDAVGRVHFGFVVEFVAMHGTVKARDEAISDPHFVTVSKLKGMQDQLENWSRLVLKGL